MLEALDLFLAKYTKGRSANLDKLDALVSARIKASDGWSATVAGRLDATVSSRLSTLVNSIQAGTISLSAGTGSATATITSVNTSKAVLIWLGTSYNINTTTQGDQALIRLALTNGTTITATRSLSTTWAAVVQYIIIEFK